MSSKYSEQVIETACEAIDWAEGLVVTDTLAVDVFDTLERAPWWEKVQPGYEFQPGEPYREECAGRAWEHSNEGPYRPISSFAHEGSLFRYFRDTRWQPPVKPLKVGDLIDTVAQAESLPIGTIAVSRLNTPIRKANTDEWRRVDKEALIIDSHMAGYGDRIIYLPSGDFNE